MSVETAYWHDDNPWNERVVYVPLEELAEALAGGDIQLHDGSVVPLDAEFLIEHWNRLGDHLDAYILPGGPTGNSVGIRYGADGPDYDSSMNRNHERVQELLEKYRDSNSYAPR
jgi:hypothetical protein